MNKTLYKQADSRWGSKPYPKKGSSFAGNGCGCVACTHLIIEQEKYKNLTPEPVRKWMVSQGYAVYNQGTTWSGIPATLKHYGFSKVVHIGVSDPMSKAWTELNKGNRIGVILFKGGKAPNGTVWTSGGHYVAFTDYYVKNGKHYFYTKDSGSRNHDSAKYGYYTYENSMKGLVYQMWIVQVPKEAITTTTSTKTTTTAAASSKNAITVDGKFGKQSIKALQKVLGTTQDGIISGQLSKLKKYHTGFSSGINYGSGGSACIKALQKMLKLSGPDGQLGPNTIKSFQKYLGMSGPDGYWGPNTSKAVQKWINSKLAATSAQTTTTPAQTTTTTTTSTASVKIKGMDISAWQGKISKANFEKAKASGIKFVILRVGYTGSSSKTPTIDKVFENNYKNAIAAGLPVGVYFYSLATNTTLAKKEANFVIQNIKGKQITYPVYIDVEDNATQGKVFSSKLATVCNTFCSTVKAAGYKPGVYASLSWFNSKIGNITVDHTKWVAQYYKECQYKGAYDMWQYSSSESVPGIADKVDVNWCYKNFNIAPVPTKSVDEIALEVLDGLWGAGTIRKTKLINAGYDYDAVQSRVNAILKEREEAAEQAKKLADAKTIAITAIFAYKNLANYREAQKEEINQELNTGKTSIEQATSIEAIEQLLKSIEGKLDTIKTDAQLTAEEELARQKEKELIDKLANEVLEGKWGSGDKRKANLVAAGYDYDKVQNRVNEILAEREAAAKAEAELIEKLANEVLEGKWGSGDKRKENLIAAGYDYDKVQARVNEIISNKENSVVLSGMRAWATKIANDNKYSYKKWTDDVNTHKCPICNPGTGDGWNCIGYTWAIWRHGGKLKNRCNCGVINNATAEKILKASDAEALKIVQERLKIDNVEVIRNGGKVIPKSWAKPGDVGLLFNGDTYTHTFFIMDSSHIADSTGSGSAANQIRADRAFDGRYVNQLKVLIRYTNM